MTVTAVSRRTRIDNLFSYQKDYLKGKSFESLDVLRAVGALLVLFYHVQGLKGLTSNGIKPLSGAMGSLFFVLSSFLLINQLLKMNFSFQETNLWIDYASRRLLRVYSL